MPIRRLLPLFVFAIVAFARGFAFQAKPQPAITPQSALARVLQQSPAQADWFDSSFLAVVPATQIDQVVKQYVGQLGSFQSAEPTPDGFRVHMERGSFPAKIGLNAEGRITTLWFGLPELKISGIDNVLKELAKLPGQVSVVVIDGGKARAGLQPDLPLAVGSTFKLAILAALQEQIAAGKHRLDEIQPLRPAWKSLPSGTFHRWPDGTPLTIATLANQMISISDNTAADALLSIVGRENAEQFAPRNKPFLSTREAFILKSPSNSVLADRYRKADETGRRTRLEEVDRQPLPKVDDFMKPVALDIEWFFTTNELCALIAKISTAPALHINPGVAKREDWKEIAYKGGSEEGVLNLTTLVTASDGRQYCVSATWNNSAPVDQTRFFTLYGTILSGLREPGGK